MRRPRFGSLLGSLALAATLVVAPGAWSAHADDGDDVQARIIGGQPVPAGSVPWAVGLYSGDYFFCSGTLIAERWVLTARHCVEGGRPSHVLVGDVRARHGTRANVTRVSTTDDGDIALLRLARSIRTGHARLASQDPPRGATNYIYGWGTTEVGDDVPTSDVLKRGSVRVTGRTSDYYGGPAINSTKVDGTAGYGDSGGPEFHNGTVVGVCSTGDYVRTQYASVAAHRSWIARIAGV